MIKIVSLAVLVFIAGCEQLPVRDTTYLMDELRDGGCEVKSVSVIKRRTSISCK